MSNLFRPAAASIFVSESCLDYVGPLLTSEIFHGLMEQLFQMKVFDEQSRSLAAAEPLTGSE